MPRLNALKNCQTLTAVNDDDLTVATIVPTWTTTDPDGRVQHGIDPERVILCIAGKGVLMTALEALALASMLVEAANSLDALDGVSC